MAGATPGRTFAISGAYDLSGSELPALLRGGQILPEYAVAYTTYMLVAWNRIRSLYDRPAELFRQPYAGRVERLFNGSTPGPRMLAALPRRLDEQAVAANTGACGRRLRAHGATVQVRDLGRPLVFGSPHLGTNVAGTVDAVRRLVGAGER